MMNTFNGTVLNSGKVAAQVCLYSAELHESITKTGLVSDAEITRELARFKNAIQKSRRDLETVRRDVAARVGRAEAEIFLAQIHIMTDPTLVEKVEREIKQGRKNAEHAVFDVYRAYEKDFLKMDNEYLRDRANDIADIRKRLLDHIREVYSGFKCEGQVHCRRGLNRIIVARELSPNMIGQIDFTKVRGFVTEHGGMSSHAAIIARALGVPAVSGVHGLLESVKCGDTVIIDGDSGRIYLEPDRATLEKTIRVEPVETGARCLLVSPRGLAVLANAGMMEDVEAARQVNADGIGLFRTEFAFIRAGRLLSESEQAKYYAEIISKMDGKPVTIRLLDIGGDKPLPFLSQEAEENPMLGVRGSRFLLKNRDIFRTQVRALARASKAGPVNVLFPMVVDARQLDLLLSETGKVLKGGAQGRKNIRLGVMFEVPGACLQAHEILKKIDFASIGSNDLFQYLFAMDRDNEHVMPEYDPVHPVLWELISLLAREARRARKPLSLCGEMAAQPGMAKRLVKAGIAALSVSPRFVPAVRNEIARIRR